MKVKVLKAEGKGKKKGLFINHLIFDAPIDLIQCNNRKVAFGGHNLRCEIFKQSVRNCCWRSAVIDFRSRNKILQF